MSSNVVKLRDIKPTPTEKYPEPDLGNEMYPVDRYISKEFADLEWKHFWTKIWMVGAWEKDLQDPGDYVTTEIGKESILLTRAEDGKLRAFYNICQHRGNRLVPGEFGKAESFTCPYHSWVWKVDGGLEHVEDDWDFPQGLPCSKLSLREIPCDTWGGWVWFNLNPKAEPLMEYLGDLPGHLDCYQWQDWALVGDYTVIVDCNWKTACDNFNEMYHVRTVHHQLMNYMDDVNAQVDLMDKGHTRLLVPCMSPTPRGGIPEEVPDMMRAEMKEWGLDPADFKGRVPDVRRAMQQQRRKLDKDKGYDFSLLNDNQLTDTYHYFVFPNLTVTSGHKSLAFLRPRPHATDHEKCLFDVQYYQRLAKDEPWPERPDHHVFELGAMSLGEVIDQDVAELKNVQLGMHSDGFDGFWMNVQERRIRWFHEWIDKYVYGPLGQSAP